MKTVHEVSALAGVSVRTLHHYDAIGLLKPSRVTEAGYRLYDDAALGRLQAILMFRELRFPLKEIGRILDSPSYDRRQALAQQIEWMEMERSRLGALIALARRTLETGGNNMDFSAFDRSAIERYQKEARQKWGDTDAYREQEKRAEQGADFSAAGEGLMCIFKEMGAIRAQEPDSDAAQALVKKLMDYITANFYPCTKEILAGLGQMYTFDERFAANIDAAGGAGTAEFAARAIAQFTRAN